MPRPLPSGDSEPSESDKENSHPHQNGRDDQEDQDQRGCEDSDDSEDGEIRYKDDYDPSMWCHLGAFVFVDTEKKFTIVLMH